MDAPNPTAGSSEPSKIGYPNSPCNKSGHQTVQEDPLHRIYWEEYGPADGEPVMFLHGGPGRARDAKSFLPTFSIRSDTGSYFSTSAAVARAHLAQATTTLRRHSPTTRPRI